MKVCIHLEFLHFLGGIAYKKLGSGMLSSYRNQIKMLEESGFSYVEKWENSCDVLMVNLPWLHSFWLMKRAKAKGKKVIAWTHVTAEDMVGVFWFNKYIAPLVRWYLKHFYGSADVIFSPSAYTKRLVSGYGINPDKIMVQSNGVNLKNFYRDENKRKELRERYGLKRFTVGTVALVLPRKGIDTFLYLAKKFPEMDFIWYGKIYSSLMVKPEYKTTLPNVKFTGFVDDKDLNGAFNSLDAFIFPSYEENQGMAPIEAAAAEVPVLVRDLPVYKDWLTNHDCCLRANTDEEFAECIKKLSEDEEYRKKCAQEIRKVAEENSLEILQAQFKKVLGIRSMPAEDKERATVLE